MRKLLATLVVAIATITSLPALAAPANYSTADTDLGTLIDDPASRVLVEKHIPGMTTNPQVEMAKGMTLRQIQAFAPDDVTDERLNNLDKELAKLPAKN